ncbi:MAG: hypothetical protein JO062_01580 [Bryobacterales bacterium]|nr:hypothetical protein [Bryobacterales bacterium]
MKAEACSTCRGVVYSAVLLGLNVFVAWNLFSTEFTNNMQTNAGSFMAIARFILDHFPHLSWFPFWFNGLPFENVYTPLLHLIDAGFAWITRASPARAYNFVTGAFYAAGPVFLFLFVWRITRLLETSFFAALLYSLFSPAAILRAFRPGGSPWNAVRFQYLAYWGEGPHIAALALLPIALFACFRAFTRRTYAWCAAAAILMAATVLINTFGAADLALGCACLVLALPRKEMARAAAVLAGVAVAAYSISLPFMPPSWIGIVSESSQHVDGDFSRARLLGPQLATLPGVFLAWWAVRKLENYVLRFSILLAYLLLNVIGLYALANVPVLPQPHRYAVEFELAACIAFALALRPLVLRLSSRLSVPLRGVAIALALAAAAHQTVHYHRYARQITQPIDIGQTEDYKAAKWLDQNLSGLRTFISGETGTWLNVFTDVPQMNSGHQPFDPNFRVDSAVIFSIYTGMNAGARDAENSILWMKAFGCHAVYIARSRLYGDVFRNPRKFERVLPVLWREGNAAIYGIPQRTKSLAHVVPEAAIVKREPVNGLDTAETARYVAALDDASLPPDVMEWPRPDRGHIGTTIRPGQVLSVQVSYDPGWLAFANGKQASVTRDGIGLSVIHPVCDGPCSIDFVFDGGPGRRWYWGVSGLTILVGLAGILWGGMPILRRVVSPPLAG